MWRADDREGDGPKAWRAARLGDVTILLPVFTRVGFYEQALREAGLPYRIEGGRTYFARREVLDTLAVLRAVDQAVDQVSVYAALHADLFGFSDDDLFAFRHAGGSFDYLAERAAPDGFAEVGAALDLLRELHGGRNGRAITATIDELLRRSRFLENLATWSDDPEQAIGNVAKLVALADEFGASAGGTFHAFVDKMGTDARMAETAESPVGEPGDFVRLMTVHKAKGLEFPVVILASMAFKPRALDRVPLLDRGARRLECSLVSTALEPARGADKSRFESAGYEACFKLETDAQEHERRRVLYVAATRAADQLVIPVVGPAKSGTKGSLLSYLMPHLGLSPDDDSEVGDETDERQTTAAQTLRLTNVRAWAGRGRARSARPRPRPATRSRRARRGGRSARRSCSRPRARPPSWRPARSSGSSRPTTGRNRR